MGYSFKNHVDKDRGNHSYLILSVRLSDLLLLLFTVPPLYITAVLLQMFSLYKNLVEKKCGEVVFVCVFECVSSPTPGRHPASSCSRKYYIHYVFLFNVLK